MSSSPQETSILNAVRSALGVSDPRKDDAFVPDFKSDSEIWGAAVVWSTLLTILISGLKFSKEDKDEDQ